MIIGICWYWKFLEIRSPGIALFQSLKNEEGSDLYLSQHKSSLFENGLTQPRWAVRFLLNLRICHCICYRSWMMLTKFILRHIYAASDVCIYNRYAHWQWRSSD